MIKIYQDNGLPFFDAAWLHERDYIQRSLEMGMTEALKGANKAWDIHRIEAPSLIPYEMVSAEYSPEDVFMLTHDDYYLKPETTHSSYEYAAVQLLEHDKAKPPLCVWQASKSFRRENDQVTKNVRLKEFYQQEFQCIVTKDTKMDYQSNSFIEQVYDLVERATGAMCRIVPSERVPSYSEKTIDIEAFVHLDGDDPTQGKWLEVCSISKRNDVPFDWDGKELMNYEFAFGLDRLTHVKRNVR